MSFQTIESTINVTTVAAFKTRMDALNTEANLLVTTETAMRLFADIRMTLTGGTQTSIVFTITYDVYDDTTTALATVIAQLTAALTAIEGASTYSTVTKVAGPVKILVTE